MVNYEIQNTGKFDMLTYFCGTNSVVVLSPDCTLVFKCFVDTTGILLNFELTKICILVLEHIIFQVCCFQKTEGYSGSDIKLVCKEAAMRPVRKIFDALENHSEGT